MSWNMDFISEQDFRTHVSKTIDVYIDALKSAVDLKKFNKNIIDPIKFVFDKALYGLTWKELVDREILRQKDKTVNNSIGYFHQKIFQYIHRNGCLISVPENGEKALAMCGDIGGWDVVFENKSRLFIDPNTSVKRLYVEMKNKHNTMNSASSSKTYQKMQRQIVEDDDCACFLVEAIASESRNDAWVLNGKSNKKIRRVSMDEFYGIVTNDSLGFFKICEALPSTIRKILSCRKNVDLQSPESVCQNLEEMSGKIQNVSAMDADDRMTMAMYMLSFGSYKGFSGESFLP